MIVLAVVLVVMQLFFTVQVINNVRYALRKAGRDRKGYRPKTVLIVPCKGLDEAFAENIQSFYRQDYENYLLWFVVEDTADPAYESLILLREQAAQESQASEVRILVAGKGAGCSQKLHNLLFAYQQIPAEAEVLAFADSDACPKPNWLSHLVYPLRQDKVGVSSGYRWFVPERANAATIALSAVNAKVGQLLGNTRFNQAWGGSMAVRTEVFRRLEMERIWEKALSDDLSISSAARNAGLKIAFAPACMVASYESNDWGGLFEFARRQFVITRVYTPKTWWFGLFSGVFSVFGFWGGVAALLMAEPSWPVVAWPVVFGGCQFFRAILRQVMGLILLGDGDRRALRPVVWADVLLFWAFSVLLLGIILSSAVGRTIRWRGIRYRLNGPLDITILN